MLKKMFAVVSLVSLVMMPMVTFAEEILFSAGVKAGKEGPSATYLSSKEGSVLLAEALIGSASVQVATLSQDEMEEVKAGSKFSKWRRENRKDFNRLVNAAVFITACALGVPCAVVAQ